MDSVTVDPVILKGLPFLADIDDAESWYTLAKELQSVSYSNGEVVFTQGQPADATYYVLEGTVRWERRKDPTELGEPILSHYVGKERLIGHFALLYNEPYPMTATAEGTCLLLRMGNNALNRLIYRFPTLRQRMIYRAPSLDQDLNAIDIAGRLRTVPWLAELDIMDISLLAEEVTPRKMVAKQSIYNRDEDMPDTFYIIDRGQVQLLHPRKTEDVGLLGNGAVFGITPLLGGNRYSNIADTVCPSIIFAVPRSILDGVVQYCPGMKAGDQRKQRKDALASTRLFADLTADEISRLAGFASHIYIPPPQHHLISLQKEAAHALWLLMPGSTATLHVLDKNGEALPKKPVTGPIHFGEAALLMEAPITSTIEANPGSQWLKLDRQDFLAFDQMENGQIVPRLKPSPSTLKLRRHEEDRQKVSWLATDETLLQYDRRHWVVILRKLFPGLIMTGVALLLLLTSWGLRLNSGMLWVVAGAVGIVAALAVLWGWLDYLNDFLFVTNKRVVQQDKVIFFNETRREAPLYQIQDILVQVGLIGNLLGYGTVVIQTAAKEGNIVFDFAPDPATMRDLIFAQIQAQHNNMQAQTKMHIQEQLEGRLGIKLAIPDRVLLSSSKKATALPTTRWKRWWAQVRALWNPAPEHWESSQKVVWRQHWIVLVSKLVTPVVLFLISIIVGLAGFVGVQSIAGVFEAVELVATVVGLIALGIAGWIFADWRNDTYELSDNVIVDISKLPLFFAENRRQAQLSEIQDIQFDMPTPIHYFLNFGDVRISTAATGGIFTFDRVPDPASVVDEIRRRIEKWRYTDEANRAKKRSEELPDWFEIYKRLDS